MTSEVPFNFHILSLQIYIQTQLVFQAEYPHKGASSENMPLDGIDSFLPNII